ncbi:hypothetical protein [Streptomyces sp. CB02923]|uniref:hypothetical protein n=1 Tax=Streptomyces sp. CB02923 TaxID=1718985 RepID=UPI0019020FAD|nr:hypothetical protein [Streptomyces sp. CB02923]
MSATLLHLVSEDPYFSPLPAVSEAAFALLRRLVPGASGGHEVREFAGVAFIDPGGNWSGVRCPECASDVEDWWVGAMERAAGADGFFGSLAVMTPCCSASTDLNALDYVEAAGFARYGLVVTDPERELPLASADVRALGGVLGTDLRQVIARY